MPLQPPLKCYTDEPANEPESSPRFTTATATSLAAFAGIPGSASGVLDLVPFLKARNGRRGPGHGLETSGWVTSGVCGVSSRPEKQTHRLQLLQDARRTTC